MVLLHEGLVDAEIAPAIDLEALDQEAAVVAVNGRLDRDEPVEGGLDRRRHHAPSLVPYWRS